MKFFFVFLFLLSFRLGAQTIDTTVAQAGYIDSLGRKQGVFKEKQLIEGYDDSLLCSMSYENGKLSGPFTCPLKNGKRHVYGVYTDGKKHKVWTLPDTAGFNQLVIYYQYGLVEKKLYEIYKQEPDSTAHVEKIIYKYANGKTYKTEYYKLNEKGYSTLVKTRDRLTSKGNSTPSGYYNLRGPWAVTAGYNYQGTHWLELGVKKYSFLNDLDAFDVVQTVNYLLAGAEIRYNKQLIVAPKIGVGHYFTFSLLNFNLNCILYNDRFQNFDPAITPEIGFSLPVAYFQIDYGYNFFLRQEKFTKGQNHRLSIRINFPFL